MHVNILTTTGYNWSNRCEFFTTLHKKQREDRGSSSPGVAGKTAPSISGNPVEAIVPDAVYRTFTRRCPSIRRLSRPDASDANTLYVYERNVNVHPQTGIARQTLLRLDTGLQVNNPDHPEPESLRGSRRHSCGDYFVTQCLLPVLFLSIWTCLTAASHRNLNGFSD